jgi:hypothetical protein
MIALNCSIWCPRWASCVSLVLGALFSLVVFTSAKAVDLKPKAFPLTVLGIRAEVPVSVSFDATSETNALVLRIKAEGNLKDVQAKALDIARAIPMPRDNCARSGVNPVVNSIDSASITSVGNTAVIKLSGHVTAWLCAHPFGVTVKTIGASDSVSLSAPVELVLVNPTQIGLKLSGPVSVMTGNALTAEIANLLTGDLSASITSQLTKALDADEARARVPELPGLEAAVQNAEFAAAGPDLLVRIRGTARMSSTAFNGLLELLSK